MIRGIPPFFIIRLNGYNILFYLRHHAFGWALNIPTYTDEPETDEAVIASAYPFTLTEALIAECAAAIDSAHA